MWIRVSGQSHGQPKGGYKQVRDQISDVSHLTLDIKSIPVLRRVFFLLHSRVLLRFPARAVLS